MTRKRFVFRADEELAGSDEDSFNLQVNVVIFILGKAEAPIDGQSVEDRRVL